mmetsp:Transcript_65901/g.183601  ORF Transcript_65901/g.183601 Transcript_65901/m.183601 type:complete len:557 (+) Transcript_65901:274-1944(+)
MQAVHRPHRRYLHTASPRQGLPPARGRRRTHAVERIRRGTPQVGGGTPQRRAATCVCRAHPLGLTHGSGIDVAGGVGDAGGHVGVEPVPAHIQVRRWFAKLGFTDREHGCVHHRWDTAQVRLAGTMNVADQVLHGVLPRGGLALEAGMHPVLELGKMCAILRHDGFLQGAVLLLALRPIGDDALAKLRLHRVDHGLEILDPFLHDALESRMLLGDLHAEHLHRLRNLLVPFADELHRFSVPLNELPQAALEILATVVHVVDPRVRVLVTGLQNRLELHVVSAVILHLFVDVLGNLVELRLDFLDHTLHVGSHRLHARNKVFPLLPKAFLQRLTQSTFTTGALPIAFHLLHRVVDRLARLLAMAVDSFPKQLDFAALPLECDLPHVALGLRYARHARHLLLHVTNLAKNLRFARLDGDGKVLLHTFESGRAVFPLGLEGRLDGSHLARDGRDAHGGTVLLVAYKFPLHLRELFAAVLDRVDRDVRQRGREAAPAVADRVAQLGVGRNPSAVPVIKLEILADAQGVLQRALHVLEGRCLFRKIDGPAARVDDDDLRRS